MVRPPAALPEWLLAELGPTLRLATALTGAPIAAADLVAETLVRDPSWQASPDADSSDRLRGAIGRCFLRSPGEAAVDGLDTLPPLTRAAVVLHDGERITVAEIATILDRPIRRIARAIARHGGRHDLEIGRRQALAPPAALVAERYPEAVVRLRAERHRHRAHAGLGVGAAAAAALLAALLPPLVVQLLPPDLRTPGEWRMTHRLELADDWDIEQQRVTKDTEQTRLRVPYDGGTATCLVTLGRAPGAAGRPVQVSTRWSASYVEPADAEAYLHWQYAPGAHARVACGPEVGERLTLSVAAAVRFRGAAITLPFMLDELPAGTSIASVEIVPRAPETTESIAVTLTPAPGTTAPAVAVQYGDLGGTYRCVAADGSLRRRSTTDSSGEDRVCLSADWTGTQGRGRRGAGRAAMMAVAEHLRLAPNLADRGTWFDATDLPG